MLLKLVLVTFHITFMQCIDVAYCSQMLHIVWSVCVSVSVYL